MKLTAKSEYACLALIELASRWEMGVCSISDIAKSQCIPKKFLEQILLTLKRGGYVKSKKGVDGGYSLAKPPKDISVAGIVRLMDGALAPVESASTYFYEPTPVERSPRLLGVFRDIRNYISDKLENTTFADLVPDKETGNSGV
jgi:Rrf2 family protein